MFTTVTKKGSKQAPVVTKFCKVCKDAGKPESVYTSHFVRASPDPRSPVVCPTLLEQACGYCGIEGHTVKYCKVLEQNQKAKAKAEAEAAYLEQEAKKATKAKAKGTANGMAKGNRFASAYIDWSDDEEDPNYPALSVKSTTTPVTAGNYAAALAKPKSKPVEKPIVKPVEKKPVKKVPVAEWVPPKTMKMTDWATAESDDEDEDDVAVVDSW